MINQFLGNVTQNLSGASIRDLKLNFEKFAQSELLSKEEVALLLLALGKSLNFNAMVDLGKELAISLEIPNEHILEAKQVASIMGMLNTYYKFRFFVEKNDPNAASEYGTPGLRMNALSKPAIGKIAFELLALGVSILNSCEKCVVAHEKTLIDLGVSRAKIHDVMRIAAIAKGLSAI